MFPKKRSWFGRKRRIEEERQSLPKTNQDLIFQSPLYFTNIQNNPFSSAKRPRPSLQNLLAPPCPCYFPEPSQVAPETFYETHWKGYCRNPVHRALAPNWPTIYFSDNYRAVHDCIQKVDIPGLNWGFENKQWAWQIPVCAPIVQMYGPLTFLQPLPSLPAPPPLPKRPEKQKILPDGMQTLQQAANWQQKRKPSPCYNQPEEIHLNPHEAKSILAEILLSGTPAQMPLKRAKPSQKNNQNPGPMMAPGNRMLTSIMEDEEKPATKSAEIMEDEDGDTDWRIEQYF